MEIEVNKEIVVQKEITKIIEKIRIVQIIDNYVSVEVLLEIPGYGTTNLILWKGEDYNNIGQYTDTDIENRILEII